MADNKQYLVVFGVPSIKKFVFGTDPLKEIRGASALLDDLNRVRTREFLTKDCGALEKDIIFLGGGAGQFILSSDRSTVEGAMHKLEKLYANETAQGLRLLWEMAEYNGENYREARQKAENRSQIKRDENPFQAGARLHCGYIGECKSCSSLASVLMRIDNESNPFCHVCYQKRAFERKIKQGAIKTGASVEFLAYLYQMGIRARLPEKFDAIGDQCAARKGYTALVYADGNSMGNLINAIENQADFKFFSETVDKAIRQACHEALYQRFFEHADQRPETLPADILLLGGDDLVVYMTAESALPFAVDVADKFNAKTKAAFDNADNPFFKDKLQGKGLTISLGIAFGKSHTPFSMMLSQAEELLKSAKEAGDKHKSAYYAPTYIDYHLTTAFNRLEVADCRKTHLELPGEKAIRLYRKPYSLADVKALLTHAYNLKAKQIPSTRLKRLGYAPMLGKVNGSVECLRIYANTSKGEKRRAIWEALEHFDCIENMPWNEKDEHHRDTVLTDLIEIADFIRPGPGRN